MLKAGSRVLSVRSVDRALLNRRRPMRNVVSDASSKSPVACQLRMRTMTTTTDRQLTTKANGSVAISPVKTAKADVPIVGPSDTVLRSRA